MQDQVIVITGASSGIGAALAELAAKGGARPVLVARREKELGEVGVTYDGAHDIVVGGNWNAGLLRYVEP